jgi:hypothetical protein
VSQRLLKSSPCMSTTFLEPAWLVKAVHVLGADEKTVLQRVFKFRKGEVSWIRFGRRSHTSTHGIELPDQPGIAVPSFGRSDLLDPVIPPEAAQTTESWNAAFSTHSCSGKNEDAVSGGNCEHGRTTAKLTAFCHFSHGLGSGLIPALAGSLLFLDLVWTALCPFFQLFSLPLQSVRFGAFLCHTHSLTQT